MPGCEPIPLGRLHKMADCRPVALPHFVAGPVLNRLFNMRLTTFPAPELDHLRYVCMVDGTRARDELAFEPRFDLDDTMKHLRLTRLLNH